MALYINKVRQQLHNAISLEGSSQNWDHIIKQIGMFCYSGLNQVQVIVNEHGLIIFPTTFMYKSHDYSLKVSSLLLLGSKTSIRA